MSKTVITCAQVAELPQASVALYVLVNINRLIHVMLVITSLTSVTATVPPQLSDVITEAGFTGGTCAAHCTVTFGGQVIVGGVLSKTVITCAQVAELPQASVALYVRVRIKRLIQVMFVTASLTCVTVTVPAQLSDVTTKVVFTGGTRFAH